jgi:hypothetical protein
MSAYKDKAQNWVVFKFPDGNIYKMSPEMVDVVPPEPKEAEGHSLEIHQDMVQLGNDYLQLLLESDEPYNHIKDWMIASLNELFGEGDEDDE